MSSPVYRLLSTVYLPRPMRRPGKAILRTWLTMSETWLKPNRRILGFAAVLPALLAVIGIALLVLSLGDEPRVWLRTIGGALTAFSLVGLVFLIWQLGQARLATDGRHLRVNLGTARAVAVPLDVVEGFLLGQGPAFLPGNKEAQVTNLVVRLAERAGQWERVEVNRQFGMWCGHYITIRGTWCEPLSVDLVNRLNARLAEVKKTLHHEARR